MQTSKLTLRDLRTGEQELLDVEQIINRVLNNMSA
jgi:hypothetical protein